MHEIFHHIIPNFGEPLEENSSDYEELTEYVSTRKLCHIKGEIRGGFQNNIDGKTYILDENPMGIEYIRIDFEGDKGNFSYKMSRVKRHFDLVWDTMNSGNPLNMVILI